jgi:hypothetical protein
MTGESATHGFQINHVILSFAKADIARLRATSKLVRGALIVISHV